MPRKYLIVLFFLAFAPPLAGQGLPLLSDTVFAQTPQTECPPECTIDSMEIVTWYPSPYNEYEELRLYPKRSSEESQCNSFEQLGLMYYNQDQEMLKVCRLDSSAGYRWEPVSYWKSSGDNIYSLNSGYVGIGKDNPSYSLDIQGKINAVDALCINNDCKTSWSSVSGGMSSSQISTTAVDTSVVKGYTKVAVGGMDYALPYYEYSKALVNSAHSTKQCRDAGGIVVQGSSGEDFCKFVSGSCSSMPGGWTQYLNWSTTIGGQVCGDGSVCGSMRTTCCDPGGHSWSIQLVEACSYCPHVGGGRSGCSCTNVTAYASISEVGCY